MVSIGFLPNMAAIVPQLPGASSPLVTFLALMGGVALLSFAAEYLAYSFGNSPMQNWRMSITAITIGLVAVFWRVWSRQIDFVDQSINPENTGFRMTLWLFIVISALLPFWMCYSASFSVCRERWLPGISLFAVRIVSCVGIWAGYIWMGTSVVGILNGVKLV